MRLKEKKPIFKVVKWTAVAAWSWDISVDNCAICRNHIMDLCIECQAKMNENEPDKDKDKEKDKEIDKNKKEKNKSIEDKDNCTVAWGVCNHAFHLHCISRWIKARQVCPLDNTKWEFQHTND